MTIIICKILRTKQSLHNPHLKTEVRIHSTAQKLVRGFSFEPLAPLRTILVNWLDTPHRIRDSLSGIHNIMQEEVRNSGRSCS